MMNRFDGGRIARGARALSIALLLVEVSGCAAHRGGPGREARSPAARASAALTNLADASPCDWLALTVDDATGALTPWMEAVVESTIASLRRGGVRAYDHVPRSGRGAWLALAARRSGREVRVRIERRDTSGVQEILRIDPPPAELEIGPAPVLAGRHHVAGPTFAWDAYGLRIGPSGRLFAETRGGAVPLDVALEGERLDVRARAPVHLPPPAGRRSARPGSAFVLAPAPAPLRDVPLTGYAGGVRGGFVAVDVWGTLLYGAEAALWGPPASGHGGQVVPLDDGFVTASASLPGAADALYVVAITPGRRLEVRERIELGPGSVAGLAALDVDADGRADLVLARAVAGGTRIDAFVSGGEMWP